MLKWMPTKRIGMKIIGTKVVVFLGIMLALYAGNMRAATTLLPNGKQCFSATVGTNGMIGALGSITGGSGYVNGVYGNVALTGGSGSGGTANITVAGGAVSSVLIQLPGINYVVGNSLSASNTNLGGAGSGFSVPVNSIAVNASLAGGQVNMFVPNTTTIKATWQDASQTAANTNPIILDANGCAIIYGIGTYRQQLLDSLGNLIWDQLTTDTSAPNSILWGATAGGTPNAITVSGSGFSSTDGQGIQFIALSANTGNTTLNPGTGPLVITKDTSSGPSLLTGGELQPGNVVYVTYSSTTQTFHILNPLPTVVSNGIQIGFEISCPGFTPPTNYVLEFGQQLNRNAFNTLFLNLTFSQPGIRTNGNNTLTGISDTSQFAQGQPLEGAGIPGGTTITSTTINTIVMSAVATSSGTSTVTVFPYGNGDGSTTFNVPDRRGVTLFGRDNMGGTPLAKLTTAFSLVNPDALGSLIGGQSQTMTIPQLPVVNLGTLNVNTPVITTNSSQQARNDVNNFQAMNNTNVPSTVTVTIPSFGSGNAHTIIPPGATTNMCLRVQ